MPIMALLPPEGLLGGYAEDPGGASSSWEEACTCLGSEVWVPPSVIRRTQTGAPIRYQAHLL